MRYFVVTAGLAVAAAMLWLRMSRPEFVVHDPQTSSVLVTGASTGTRMEQVFNEPLLGIGRDAAVTLARLGYTVFAGVRREADAQSLRDEGIATLKPLLLDVTLPETVARARTEVAAWLTQSGQQLVGLVNNAGISVSAPIETIPLERYMSMHEINVVGVLRVTQAFLPLIRASKGRVVNVGSILGIISMPVHGTYAATKMALEGINTAMRRELLPMGVAVSMVNPGAVATAIVAKATKTNTELYDGMTPEEKAVYGNATMNFILSRKATFQSASPTSETTAAIQHALNDPFPQVRYLVATAGGKPVWVLAAASWFLPEHIFDKFVLSSLEIAARQDV